jgi:hypothetical protein
MRLRILEAIELVLVDAARLARAPKRVGAGTLP